jgi:hypothetical protein
MKRDLAISCEYMDCERLLLDWRWLVPTSMTPLLVGIFGDWVFGAPDATYWHLDLMEGSFRQVARNSDEFNAMKEQNQYRNEWFGAEWADIALGNGIVPKLDECLGWNIAPVFGGPFEVENVQVFSLFIYQSIQGQIFRQLSQG